MAPAVRATARRSCIARELATLTLTRHSSRSATAVLAEHPTLDHDRQRHIRVARSSSTFRSANAAGRRCQSDSMPASGRVANSAGGCQFAPSCSHPICRVMRPEGRVETTKTRMPRIGAEVDRGMFGRGRQARDFFAGSCSHPESERTGPGASDSVWRSV